MNIHEDQLFLTYYSFLYYVINGVGQGLYRIALGAISHLWSTSSSLPSLSPSVPELIIPMDDLLTHVIDFYNVRLYVINGMAKMMMTAFLDGSNMRPFHEKTVSSAFINVSSMVYYNQVILVYRGLPFFFLAVNVCIM